MIQTNAFEKELLTLLETPDTLSVCFVCTGNTCRSPMAAALFNHLAEGKNMYASSAGIHATPGEPIAQKAVEVLQEANVPESTANRYQAHRAKNITADMMERADRVICMTSGHAFALINAFPQFASKISTFKREISDPYGGTLQDYRQCLDQIKTELIATFPALSQDEKKGDVSND